MTNFEAIVELAAAASGSAGDNVVTKLFEGERRRILGIQLKNGSNLA